MKIQDSIKAAMKVYIERVAEIEDVEITSWEEEFDVYTSGGCSCCNINDYEKEVSVTIYYTWNGSRCHTFRGTFTELIQEMDRE